MTKTCTIHNVEMQERWRKDDPEHTGESFFSHKWNGGWCNGPKPAQGKSEANTPTGEQSKALVSILSQLGALKANIDSIGEMVNDIHNVVVTKDNDI